MNTVTPRWLGGFALLVAAFWAGNAAATGSLSTFSGEATPLGAGTANTYVTVDQDNVPVAIGVRLTGTALEGLPSRLNNTTRCFDGNGDGQLEAGSECIGDYETVMTWPPQAELAGLPFKWMGLDWNAHGHMPPGVYDIPHFDFHFYMVDRQSVAAIRTGVCPELVDCEDRERARLPVAAEYLPAGYMDVGAVVPQMGNHLLSSASPELATPPQRFTHTMIYGAYDGAITFVEPMITREFLLGKPDICVPIAQPQRWQKPAYYPTQYCMRYLEDEAALTISLEGFVDRRTL
jgi:hypothetical protein